MQVRQIGENSYIYCDVGDLDARDLDGVTFAVLFRVTSDDVWRTPVALHSSGGTAQGHVQVSAANTVVFGHASDTSASTFTVTDADGWVLVACSKASGTATPRMHKYLFSSGTWTHEDGDSTLTDGSTPGSGGTVRFGDWQGGDRLRGRMGAAAIFDAALSDGQVEDLAAGLGAWLGHGPQSLWLFDQASEAQRVRDLCGTSHQVEIQRTSVPDDPPPGWTYGGAPILVTITAAAAEKSATDDAAVTDSATLTIATVHEVTESATVTESASVGTTPAGPELPTLFIEAAFTADAITSGTALVLDDPERGLLDTATLGSGAEIWEDITRYCSSVNIRQGSTRADSPILKYETGTATLTLRNEDRRFDPTNLDGPYVHTGVSSAVQEVLNDNPGFELGATGWNTIGGGTLTQVDDQIYAGSKAGKLTPDGVTASPSLVTDWQQDLAPGETYYASAWVRRSTAGYVYLAFHWYDESAAVVELENSTEFFVPADTWQYISFTAQAPDDATQGPMLITMPGTPAAEDVLWVDAATFARLPETSTTQVVPMVPIRIRAGWKLPTFPGLAVQDATELPDSDREFVGDMTAAPFQIGDWVALYDSTRTLYPPGMHYWRVVAIEDAGGGLSRITVSEPLPQAPIPGDVLIGGNMIFDLWQGYADSWDVAWTGPNASEVTVNASDIFKVLNGIQLPENAGVGAGDDSGARVSRVLNDIGWSATGRAIYQGDTTLQATTYGTDALSELQKASDSELGELYIDGAGRVFFRSRNASFSEDRSAVPQMVFGDGGAGELGYLNVEISYDDTQLINDVRIGRDGGTPQGAFDGGSINRYMRHSFERTDLQMDDDEVARTYAQFLVSQRAEPELRFDALEFRLTDIVPAYVPGTEHTQDAAHILSRRIGDRITVKRRPPGGGDVIERACHIRGVEHTITPGGWLIKYTLADARTLTFLTLDSEVLGVLDAGNKLGF